MTCHFSRTVPDKTNGTPIVSITFSAPWWAIWVCLVINGLTIFFFGIYWCFWWNYSICLLIKWLLRIFEIWPILVIPIMVIVSVPHYEIWRAVVLSFPCVNLYLWCWYVVLYLCQSVSKNSLYVRICAVANLFSILVQFVVKS